MVGDKAFKMSGSGEVFKISGSGEVFKISGGGLSIQNEW